MGGIGVFAKEVQRAVADGRADLAVHSAKDLPALTPPELVIAAIPERADPRDALVGATLAGIPTGGVVGTDAVRRRAQLANLRPDLEFASLRGNIATRLEKLDGGAFDAIVVAQAALVRLRLAERASEVLDTDRMLPQVGQGALAVECRADDAPTLALVESIDDPRCHREVVAERAFLETLGGGCELPCGALARTVGDRITIEVLLASRDGHVVLRATIEDGDARTAGFEAARVLLDDRGGRSLLEGA
jgi:hydroxymethylbilane synthase